MSQSSQNPDSRYAPWASGLRATTVLALLVLIARLLYLWLACPYTLVEDEAFYWTWSHRMQLSFYSKGPGIAWLIKLSTMALGDTMLAVRAPEAIIGSLTAIVIAAFTNDVLGRGAKESRAGFFAACCFLLSPMFQLTASVATIDGPYALCWILAAWAAWRGFAILKHITRPSRVALAALCIALGFLFKFTIVLLIPGLVVFAWVRPRPAHQTGTHPTWRLALWITTSVLIACAGLAPIVIWNATHHWPTIAHLKGLAGLPGGDVPIDGVAWSFSVGRILEFIGVQAFSVGLASILILIAILKSRATWSKDPDRKVRDLFLLCCGFPPILFYFLMSFVTPVQANWPLAGYLPLFPFAGALIVNAMDDWKKDVATWFARPPERRVREGFFRKRPQTALQLLWSFTVFLGAAAALSTLRLDVFDAILEKLKHTPVISHIIPARATIPIGRFTGADRMGEHASELLQRLAERRPREPFVLTQHYGRAAQLEFYMRGHPLVLCASAFVPGGRRSQYDYWPQTDLRGAMHLLGKDALIVGGYRPEDWLPFFERVELLGILDGDGKPDRPAYYGYGFRGVEAATARLQSQPITDPERNKPLPSYPSAPRAIPLTENPSAGS